MILYGQRIEMGAVESKAEVFLLALQSLTKKERAAVLSRILDDRELREDILDLATIRQRMDEPSRPFKDYLAERKKQAK